jgi:selT/selW/selH-like putative selenoprotein
VDLKPGRRASFEVTLDGELLHSKLGGQEFPDTGKLLEEIAMRLSRDAG